MNRFIPIIVAILIFSSVNVNAFSDVKSGQWYYNIVEDAVKLNLIQGYPDGLFAPNKSISYAEFVSIVARQKQLSPGYGQASHWASDTMDAALNAGWYDWDEIPPTGEKYDSPIPRKIAAKILVKAFVPDVKGDYSTWAGEIKDFNELDGRYYEPVFALYEAGIATGDESGKFNPNKELTRAEASSLIVKAVNKSGGTASNINLIPPNADYTANADIITEKVDAIMGGVSENGSLKVIGTQLSSESGTPVILRGMSSHGMQWYSNYASKESIKGTRDYGANVFRVAMYTGEGGYISNAGVKSKVFEAVDSAIALDMYAVLDWHILSDGNPQTHKEQAKAFFDEAAKRYAGNPAVIYEICNEPNGNVSWESDIRPYAMEIVPIIRTHSPNAIILIGSGTWSQDVHTIAANPLPFDNIMYTLHFYAGTHTDSLRQRAAKALDDGTPLFVSEWGTCTASGDGGFYFDESVKWMELLEKRGVSWINWSLCDKNESAAALKPGSSTEGGWVESDLTESGKFVFERFR